MPTLKIPGPTDGQGHVLRREYVVTLIQKIKWCFFTEAWLGGGIFLACGLFDSDLQRRGCFQLTV
jgi:hypothetical protein